MYAAAAIWLQPDRGRTNVMPRNRAPPGSLSSGLKPTRSIMRRMPPRRKAPGVQEYADEPVVQQEEMFEFKATHFYAVLVVLAFGIGILIGYVAWGRTPAAPMAVAQVAGPAAAATPTLEQGSYDI